ncbi:MAG: DnaJ C-terminal domain-containing protein [Caulobacteraceae bacterium]
MTPQTARKVLNAPQDANIETLSRIFREAVKQHHPDSGGDAERLREAIEAHRVLKSLAACRLNLGPSMWPAREAKPRPHRIEISVLEAIHGGERRVKIEGRAIDVTLPPGMRAGETLRLTGAGRGGSDIFLKIGVANQPGLVVRGDDIWVEARAVLPAGGGRVEIDTPRGRRAIWLSHKVGSRKLTRLAGEGLPARGSRKAGDLFVRIEANETAPETPAQAMLRRFTGAWAPA